MFNRLEVPGRLRDELALPTVSAPRGEVDARSRAGRAA
jgi:hypothetical protein